MFSSDSVSDSPLHDRVSRLIKLPIREPCVLPKTQSEPKEEAEREPSAILLCWITDMTLGNSLTYRERESLLSMAGVVVVSPDSRSSWCPAMTMEVYPMSLLSNQWKVCPLYFPNWMLC